MNIWTLRKSPRIKRALLALSEQISGFEVSDTETTNDEAVRLTASDGSGFSVYLFVYGQQEGRYGIHLEYPQPPGEIAAPAVEEQEELDLRQLTDLLQTHFY